MKVLLCLLCLIGIIYVFIFFKRKKDFINYNRIINELDEEMIANKKRIDSNKKIIDDLDQKINKLKRKKFLF